MITLTNKFKILLKLKEWFTQQNNIVEPVNTESTPYIVHKINFSNLDLEIIKLLDIPILINMDLHDSYVIRDLVYTLTNKIITPNMCDTIKYIQKKGKYNYIFDMHFNNCDTTKPYFKLSNLIKLFNGSDADKIKHIETITKKQADTKRQNLFERNKEKRYGKLVNNKGMGTIKTCYFKVHIPSEDELSFRYHYTFVDRPELEYNWIIKSHIKNKYIQVTETEVINLLKELNLDITTLKQETVIGFKKKGKPFRKVTIPSNFDICGFSTFLE